MYRNLILFSNHLDIHVVLFMYLKQAITDNYIV